jgi:hypothetical protein
LDLFNYFFIFTVTKPANILFHLISSILNARLCEISKYSWEQLLGENHRIINSGYHSHGFFEKMWATISEGEVWREDICNRA